MKFTFSAAYRWLRVLLSLTVIALAVIKRMWPLAVVGAAFLLSAFSGTCPVNIPLGRKKNGRPGDEA